MNKYLEKLAEFREDVKKPRKKKEAPAPQRPDFALFAKLPKGMLHEAAGINPNKKLPMSRLKKLMKDHPDEMIKLKAKLVMDVNNWRKYQQAQNDIEKAAMNKYLEKIASKLDRFIADNRHKFDESSLNALHRIGALRSQATFRKGTYKAAVNTAKKANAPIIRDAYGPGASYDPVSHQINVNTGSSLAAFHEAVEAHEHHLSGSLKPVKEHLSKYIRSKGDGDALGIMRNSANGFSLDVKNNQRVAEALKHGRISQKNIQNVKNALMSPKSHVLHESHGSISLRRIMPSDFDSAPHVEVGHHANLAVVARESNQYRNNPYAHVQNISSRMQAPSNVERSRRVLPEIYSHGPMHEIRRETGESSLLKHITGKPYGSKFTRKDYEKLRNLSEDYTRGGTKTILTNKPTID